MFFFIKKKNHDFISFVFSGLQGVHRGMLRMLCRNDVESCAFSNFCAISERKIRKEFARGGFGSDYAIVKKSSATADDADIEKSFLPRRSFTREMRESEKPCWRRRI